MGEIELRGATALESLQWMTCNDVSRLSDGQIHYSALMTPNGAFVDDILVHRFDARRYFLCVNSANQDKDFAWIKEHAKPGTDVVFRSEEFCQLAVQGPASVDILAGLTGVDLKAIKYYWFAEGRFAGVDAIMSRTGYTGEDGFEVYANPRHAETIWTAIMDAGRPLGLQPAGLAARNTLRLEAKMALYGSDIDATTTVLEADLGWICKLDKGDFIGRDVLLRQRREGLTRLLVGFEMAERGIARDHYPVRLDGTVCGHVTSGSPAPFLQRNIGLTYLPTDRSAPGTEIEIVIREKPVKARVVPTPFYKRPKRS
jgi:aminomethyltransferase